MPNITLANNDIPVGLPNTRRSTSPQTICWSGLPAEAPYFEPNVLRCYRPNCGHSSDRKSRTSTPITTDYSKPIIQSWITLICSSSVSTVMPKYNNLTTYDIRIFTKVVVDVLSLTAWLTHWGRDKMSVISQTTFSIWFFLNENVWIPIKISLKVVPKGHMNHIPALVQIMVWCRPGDKPLSEPIMISLQTHICVFRPQWVNIMFTSSFLCGCKTLLL